ncbi:MAG: hypothetical protein ACO1OC_04550 [Tuberibacillus sp.]
MAKIVRDIPMGDYTITLTEEDNGNYVAKLTSGEYGGMLEFEKLDDGNLRVREIDVGSATISLEQLAIMLVLTNTDDDLIKQIKKIKDENQ